MPYLEESVAEETETSHAAQTSRSLGKAIAELGEAAERLISRLAPVLSPDIPVYADESKVGLVSPARSPHVEHLEQMSDRIAQVTRNVRTAIERLDV